MRLACQFSCCAGRTLSTIACCFRPVYRTAAWVRRSQTNIVGGADPSAKVRSRNLCRSPYHENWIPRKFPYGSHWFFLPCPLCYCRCCISRVTNGTVDDHNNITTASTSQMLGHDVKLKAPPYRARVCWVAIVCTSNVTQKIDDHYNYPINGCMSIAACIKCHVFYLPFTT